MTDWPAVLERLEAELKDVQKAALQASNGAEGFAYFMEMGLGKTLVALVDFVKLIIAGKATRMVVLCPNSFKGGWVDEMKLWGLPFDWLVYEAGSVMNTAWINKGFDKPPVLVVNYESIRMAGTKKNPMPSAGLLFVERFILTKPTFLVSDESIQISTFDANQTKGALLLSRAAKYARILSGKPMKQGPHDLWSQMRFIKQLNGRDYYSFRNGFCKMGGFKGKAVVGAQNEDVLAELIDPHVFRATKADWTDLPPKVYTIREYTMSTEQRAQYKTMEDEFVLWLQDGDVITIDAAITKYIKLAQIQAGFIFDEQGQLHWLVTPESNPRLNAMKAVLSDEVAGKSIVVYNHKPVGVMLAAELAEYRPAFIKGGMTVEEIRNNKDRFNNDPDCKVICITKAAKYGHTLLGDQTTADLACAFEMFFENTYSLDDRSQLEDRPHRHGQLQSSMLYMDLVGTPLDKDCIRALQRKEDIFQSVFAPITARRR